ncbi:hypothetical protein CBR_g32544 [Chara braunii]|uniref:Uncharacterized protein n=1 Tax=Chara braunii TaxID=69332 RepID=A0A388LGV0_CHABU|nr:hypothetical protein CBR_g32544 [Chara braunii]|eukprot:GBG81554.1 hypothetical protein CBR_g32544 [Chara braunii]
MVPYAGPQASMPPPSYPAAQAQPMAPPLSPTPSSQGSVAGGGNQGQGNQGNGGRGGGRGRGRNGGGRGGQWDNQGYQGQGNQGSQGSGRSCFDWRTAICQHCDKQGHTIRFCNTRREDEKAGLIYSNMDGDIYDQFGEYIDRKVPGGVRAEARKRIATRQAPPARLRLWQEKDDPPIRVEEVESGEEVTRTLHAGVIKEEPIVVDSEEENENDKVGPTSILLGKMEDLWGKMGRYQQKLVDICEEVKGWRVGIPKVFLHESGPESMPKRPGVATVGLGSQSGMMVKPPTAQGRMAQAARTRGQAKVSASQGPSRKEPELEKRKEAVEVEDEEEEDEQDERLRQEEDQRAEQRAKKRGAQGEAERVLCDAAPRKKKYVVRKEKAVETTPPVDGFLDQEEDIPLHINEWSLRVPNCVGHPIWIAPRGYEQKAELVLKPFEEKDAWGDRDAQWMMKLALAGMHSLVEEVITIEEGQDQVEKHEELMGGMYLLVNTLLQGNFDQISSLNPAENEDVVPESKDDEFEEGEIKEAFRAEEYDEIYLESDFAKTAMPRGGSGTRPPRRPFGVSEGHERHMSRHWEHTPVYDDGDIELFVDDFRGYAEHMRWTVTQMIERLRGAGRFEEPITRIRREAMTWPEVEMKMQELRPSPVGPDGRPIHLEIGNVEDFIPAFEQFTHDQRILRDEEAMSSRGGRKALARREEESIPMEKEQGAYPECGRSPVFFQRFTGAKLSGSPQHAREEVAPSGGSLQELEAHLDISQWREPLTSEGRGEPAEEVPREEVHEPERETRQSAERGRVMEEVIEVEEDTPPQLHAAKLGPEILPKIAREEEEEPRLEEILSPPPKAILPPGVRMEMEQERTGWRVLWPAWQGVGAPERAGLGTSRMADEYLDRKIRFLAKTSFNRYLMLEDDLAEKKIKEASHEVRLDAVEAEVRQLRALVASQAAIIQDLRRQPRDEADRTEREESAEVVDRAVSSRHGTQKESVLGLSMQPPAVGLPQEPPTGNVILESEEAKAKREAEKEAFEFRVPTELATLPTTVVEPMTVAMPLSIEGGKQTASSESIQGSGEGFMDVLREAVDTMQEEASLFSPEQRVEEPDCDGGRHRGQATEVGYT